MRKSANGALKTLPSEFKFHENVNGRVSVVRAKSTQIAELEAELVRMALGRVHQRCYRAEIRGRIITIFASAGDTRTYSQSIDAEFADGFAAALENLLSRKYGQELADLFRARRIARDGNDSQPHYYPLLRFVLCNVQKRTFSVQRIYFSGDQDWLRLEVLPLTAAVMKYIPHLGKNSFFDLL